MLTEDEIEKNRTEIIELLLSTKREGVNRLIAFLFDSGYFYQYGSKKHHTYNGGLAEHSLEVMKYALTHNKTCDKSSVIIVSLLHDICKVSYSFPEDMVFVGHGSKSVAIIEDFVKFPLTYEEHNAIRFHMGKKAFIRDDDDAKRFADAQNSELWEIVHIGDCLSAGRYPKFMYGIVRKLMKIGGF